MSSFRKNTVEVEIENYKRNCFTVNVLIIISHNFYILCGLDIFFSLIMKDETLKASKKNISTTDYV